MNIILIKYKVIQTYLRDVAYLQNNRLIVFNEPI